MTVKKKTGGLAGVVAGETAIATVGKEGQGLNYRGYSIRDLAAQATFEEVAFLLLFGHLPVAKELDSFKARLRSMRTLPESLQKNFANDSQFGSPDGRAANRMFTAGCT